MQREITHTTAIRIAEIRTKQQDIRDMIESGVHFDMIRELMIEYEYLEKQIDDIRCYEQFTKDADFIDAMHEGIDEYQTLPTKRVATFLRLFAQRVIAHVRPELSEDEVIELADTL